jgi:hypothetical protein
MLANKPAKMSDVWLLSAPGRTKEGYLAATVACTSKCGHKPLCGVCARAWAMGVGGKERVRVRRMRMTLVVVLGRLGRLFLAILWFTGQGPTHNEGRRETTC